MNIPRRIVLSRKGFDSKYGGRASPILHDDTLVSMPIREEGMALHYQNINTFKGGLNFGNVVCKLKGCNVPSDSGVHLDPDLRRELHGPGSSSWRPMFGQSDAAERHLEKQDVGAKDLFLFFGWFRRVDQKLQFERSAHDEHVVRGWLQVDHYFDPREMVPVWAKHHPHCVRKDRDYNRIYVGRKSLSFATSKPGAGTFIKYNSGLRLTHPDEARRRSQWRIPAFFRDMLTYHKTAKWIDEGPRCIILSAKIGQEFVFDTVGRESEVREWLRTLFSHVPNGKSF